MLPIKDAQGLAENSKMAARPPRAKEAPNQNVSQAISRRALGDVSNIAGDFNSRCSVNSKGINEYFASKKVPQGNTSKVLGDIGNKGVNGKPIPQLNRPITRSFGAQLFSNENAAANKGISAAKKETSSIYKQSQAEVVNKQRRTRKSSVLPPITVDKKNAEDEWMTVEPAPKAKAVGNHSMQAAVKIEVKPPTVNASLTTQNEAVDGGFGSEMAETENNLPNIDERDHDNQLAVVEYVEDIYKFYRKIESTSCVPAYMPFQLEINGRMRAIVIDWLIEVHLKFKLMPETLYLTINLVDRYLSIESVSKKNLQLVGITAIIVACKYEEIWPPEIDDFIYISERAYTRQQILAMEKTMLNKLKFHLTVPTPYIFAVRFLKAAGSDKEMENLVLFLMELSLLQYLMTKYSPSLIAAAAVFTAQCALKKESIWDDILKHHTGYSETDLMECAGMMVIFHQSSAQNDLRVVHKKYSSPEFDCVALKSPAKLPSLA